MKNKILAAVIVLFMLTTTLAQSDIPYTEIVKPKPYSLSPNIVFVVDASSSINNSDDISAKFEKAWEETTSRIASDELYFCVYTFHNKGDERFRDWTNAGGPQGLEEFTKAKAWIKNNTGTYSWGQKAIAGALRKVNNLNHNRVMQRTLSIILITDGGFTEAARYAIKNPNAYAFNPIVKEIEIGQKLRLQRGLMPATFRTIGIRNTEYWSLSVKRPDSECQDFLKTLGNIYSGGYYLVGDKSK